MAEGPRARRAEGPEAAGTAAALHAAAFAGMERAWSAEEIAALAAAPGGFLLLAAGPEGGDAAMLLGRAAAGEAELLTLAAAPAARRRGLGRALLALFDAEAAARGAAEAFLEVAVDNPGAESLYRGAGWEAVGRRRAYAERPDGTRVDALVLRKDLAPAGAQ